MLDFQPIMVADQLLERFTAAVATGKYCGTSDTGPRRFAALSLRGLSLLNRHQLWPVAMQRVVELGFAHPAAQHRWLDVWTRGGGGMVRRWVDDDEIRLTSHHGSVS
jgi:hypothetical protein